MAGVVGYMGEYKVTALGHVPGKLNGQAHGA